MIKLIKPKYLLLLVILKLSLFAGFAMWSFFGRRRKGAGDIVSGSHG
jgi:hypothetical protein